MKYPDLKEKIYMFFKEHEFTTTEMYEQFSHFKNMYKDLKFTTYQRMVRRMFSNQGNNTTIDDIKKKQKERKLLATDEFKRLDEISFKSDVNNGKFKRIAVLSDLHSGHFLGLTPPNWQYSLNNPEMAEVARIQREAWEWYINTVKNVGSKVDALVVNGDLIDGRGERSNSSELITTDRTLQVSMGVECLNVWKPKKIFMTRGTPYHNGKGEQFEDLAAERMNASIEDIQNINVNGKILNFRHKVGSSGVPYGKATSVIKEGVWNQLVSDYQKVSSADVIIRSHVHYMTINQDSSRWAITTPALQVNSRYGRQQCTGITDFGFIIIDVYENGKIVVNPYVANLTTNKPVIVKI